MANSIDISPIPNTNSGSNINVAQKEIISYYDQCEIDYRWLWHLNKQNAMHYGYWKEDTTSLRSALHNMNDQVIEQLDLQDGHKILDAGCGIGGTSIYINQRYNTDIEGISLSENQIQKAQKLAGSMSLKGRSNFTVQDYCKTSFADQSFDRVYGMESICHANEKLDFLKESYRLLKKGGSLVVTDFFMNPNVKSEQDYLLMDKWADTWAVPFFEKIDLFLDKAKQAGFSVDSNQNATKNIQKSAARLHYMFYPGIVMHYVFRGLGIRSKVQGKNVWSTYYQYKSLKKDLWQYHIVKLTKT